MGSTFTTTKNSKWKGAFSRATPLPFYLQFVPGNVVDVVTSETSKFYTGPGSTNSIMAVPHISEKSVNTRFNMDSSNRYFPLFRGMVDVPAKGDPVLLCTIGGLQYYLGPLNTYNETNWNDDNLKIREKQIGGESINNPGDTIERDIRVYMGESPNFDKLPFRRMEKPPNITLDHPMIESPTENPDENSYGFLRWDEESQRHFLPEGRVNNETHGDMLFEGRHGNSIRIGSRHINPYIIISNARDSENQKESFLDGTLISITQKGSIDQHFGRAEEEPNSIYRNTNKIGELIDPNQQIFRLGSDNHVISPDITPNTRTMEHSIFASNGGLISSNQLIYGFAQNQIFMNSERITLNSRRDDILLSSFNDIHIGTGNNLTITTQKDLIIESRNIYLGRPINYIQREPDDQGNVTFEEKPRTMEPMVLGNQLLNVLNDLVDCLSKACYITPAGAPAPIIDATSAQLANKDNPGVGRKSLDTIKGELEKIISNYHYIEPNEELTKDTPTEGGGETT